MVSKVRQQVRIPILPIQNNRDAYGSSQNIDQRFVNCFLDVKQDPYTKEQVTYAVKRPGISINQDFVDIPDAGTGSFTTQGFWIFHDVAYFVNDNILYYNDPPSGDSPVALYTFQVSDLDVYADVQLWTQFGTEFQNAFTYRAVELLQEGVEVLYITNGIEDVYVKEGSNLGTSKQSYNRFAASTYYKAGDHVIPSTYALLTGYAYIAIGEAGTIALSGTEPTWPTTLGDTVVSGDVTFMCIGGYTASTLARIYTDRVYSVGNLVQPSTESGYYYEVTVAGNAVGEPATWTQIKGDTCTSGAGGVEFTCLGNYGGKPGLALPMPVFLDTYLVLNSFKSSDLYNSDPSDIYSWNPVNFISADSFTSTTKAISRYNNYIIAFSEKDAELFYNNANTTGSPFSRHESFLLQVGATNQFGVVGVESILAWSGISTAGTSCIWLLDGFEPKEISNPFINRQLSNAGGITSCFAMRIAGHLFLVFNCSSASFLFDIGMNVWYDWNVNGSHFTFDYYAFLPTSLADTASYLMSYDRNEIFSIGQHLFDDYLTAADTGTPIEVKILSSKIDFGNRYRKFGHALDIIGDNYSPREDSISSPDSTVDVYFSDDDYENLGLFTLPTTPKYEVDFTGRPRITPIGSFRRRAIMVIYDGNMPFRLEGFEMVYTQGSS
jgi:hypothetical protein